ncbi:hypothetical protein N5C54_14790 [Pseudomonas chengduensis]|uniref:hypothetical protein n=1 Tax=Pseudomonas sp. o96-267 TaxID=2479853 RepID=UPI000F7B7EBA|nr:MULTISPECIES: hypothetical protein [Pseudomonas]MDH0959047.1 hypothetical protein [Pseudomonas chengduensis]MDV5863647.1 hypothetical protein [Pseudomonas mendocina]
MLNELIAMLTGMGAAIDFVSLVGLSVESTSLTSSSGASSLFEIGKGIGDMFIQLSAEYPVILSSLLYVFAACGVIISAMGAFEIMKLGRRDSMNYSPVTAAWWRMIAGVGLIDIAFWAKVWTDTLWSNSDPLEISAYTAGQGEDYSKTALMAALGIVVIAGYVVLARAYFAAAKLGYLSPEARADLIAAIISRIVAGSLMIACLHVAEALDNSTGFNWLPV